MQVLFFVILIYSIILHEVAHGYVADKLGDGTARYAGRLTLNPLPHIDLIGSIVLPLISILSPGNFLFGWAKPVPYNPYNLVKAPRWGEALVAGAGPLTNFLLAGIFAALIRFSTDPTFSSICFMGVAANVWLGILNLIPVPPLDGSKVLGMLLPRSMRMGYLQWRGRMEMNPFLGFGLVLIIIVLFGSAFSSLVYHFATFLAGM
jgi:Zn-dependent protease